VEIKCEDLNTREQNIAAILLQTLKMSSANPRFPTVDERELRRILEEKRSPKL
jgi:hypothetical protein